MKIVFMGTPPAAARSLERLLTAGHEVLGVYTQPDRPSGRGNRISFSAVKELALERDLRLFQPAKIKTPEVLAEFKSLSAEITVVVAYGRILPEGFLDAFQNGAVNLHFSLLPKYRGAAPVNWAIVNGETTTGVTTIRMNTGLDTGDILLSREIEIGADATAVELMDRLAAIGADVLVETLEKIDIIKPVPQAHDEATFAPIMKREDGLIDWSMRSAEIAARVRGFQPFPGSFTFHEGKRLNIWSVRAMGADNNDPTVPGTIVSIDDGRLLVEAGSGTTLLIDEIQLEGKKRMAVRDALNGGHFKIGQRFTS
ncbi:MAG: methionyl-tRNA formyltransferase [Acidobacteria bacterium]|nr:methionyl-tRNA formyltransferase [Acidobacteriota bacterium]